MIQKIYQIIVYIIIILYLTIYHIYLFASSFGNINSIINYISIGIISLIFGFIYRYYQNKYNSEFEYSNKNSFYTNLILNPILVLVPTILIYLVEKISELEQIGSLIRFNLNIWILPILLIITFNIYNFIKFSQEKDFSKYSHYLIFLMITI